MKELAEALAKAQAEFQNPTFDSTNPHFRSKFASLASVRNAVIPVLAKHGVFVTQELTTTERGVACRTIFMKGGEIFRLEPLEMPATKHDAQGYGSACTYARRYSLMAACGVVGDEDDDGNVASGKKDLPGKTTPADGAFEGLDDEEQSAVLDVVTIIKDIFERDGADAAATKWKEKAPPFSTEAKAAALAKFPSQVRTAIGKQRDAYRRQMGAEQATA